MTQTALHAYLAIYLKDKLIYKNWFFPAFLLGSVLPDIDYFFSQLDKLIHVPIQLSLVNKTFMHSLITTTLIYLLILIIYELKKNKKLLNLANGIAIGLLIHIFIDLTIFLKPLDIFWPLPLNSIQLSTFNIPAYIYKLTMVLEFVLFRAFASYTIHAILNYPSKNSYLINIQSYWMKFELFFIIIFILSSYYLSMDKLFIIFFVGYIPSILTMLYTIVKAWDSLNYYHKIEDSNETTEIKERDNLININ